MFLSLKSLLLAYSGKRTHTAQRYFVNASHVCNKWALLQTNILAFLLRNIESWVGIKNIIGSVSITVRRILVSIWSHDRRRSYGSEVCLKIAVLFAVFDSRSSTIIWKPAFGVQNIWIPGLLLVPLDCTQSDSHCLVMWEKPSWARWELWGVRWKVQLLQLRFIFWRDNFCFYWSYHCGHSWMWLQPIFIPVKR